MEHIDSISKKVQRWKLSHQDTTRYFGQFSIFVSPTAMAAFPRPVATSPCHPVPPRHGHSSLPPLPVPLLAAAAVPVAQRCRVARRARQRFWQTLDVRSWTLGVQDPQVAAPVGSACDIEPSKVGELLPFFGFRDVALIRCFKAFGCPRFHKLVCCSSLR